jgi:membrane protein implicated in regulation of membrane protease activity
MTDFYAVYLFIILGVVFLIAGFVFKHYILYVLSGLGWIMSAFYSFTISAADGTAYVAVFGWFCLAAAIAMFFSPFYMGEKKEGVKKLSDIEEYEKETAEYEQQVNKYRSLGKRKQK